MIEERRFIRCNLEVRAREDGSREYRGDAIRFDEPSEDLGGFVEFVDSDCEIYGDDVRHLINHDVNLVLGRTTAGTTRLERSGEALTALTDMPDTSYARDLAVSIERRDVDQMSFAFRVAERSDGSKGDTWDFSVKPAVRHLRAIELRDVSTVTFPAYTTTTAEVRSLLRQHGIAPTVRAAGDVAWDSESGFSDYQSDISASLPTNPDVAMAPYGWVYDVAMDGMSALVCWYAESDSDGQFYVVPVVLDDQGEPSAGPIETWVAVDQEYVVADDADRVRSALLRLEARAGKAISSTNAEHLQAIADAHASMSDHLDALMSAAQSSDSAAGDATAGDATESNSDDPLAYEHALLSIHRYAPDTL